MDMVTRYFLRRLAIAREKPKWSSPYAAFSNAVYETMAVFIFFPILGVSALVVLGTRNLMRPAWMIHLPWMSGRLLGLTVSILVISFGHLYLRAKFKRFENDTTGAAAFATVEDLNAVMKQKTYVVTVCLILAPLLGYSISHWVK
jgi:hypothetical protein